MTYGGFKRMTGFCKTAVPPQIAADLEAIKDNEEAVKVCSCAAAAQGQGADCRRKHVDHSKRWVGVPEVHLCAVSARQRCLEAGSCRACRLLLQPWQARLSWRIVLLDVSSCAGVRHELGTDV